MKHLRIAAIVTGLAAYAVAFYAARLPSVLNDAGQPLSRFTLLWQLFWLPDKWLFPNWFGTPPQFCLVDRLPVLLVAAAIVAWATVLGWLLMILCRANRGLGRGELAVFSIAVGLAALSTWVLLLGLFGVMDRLWMCTVPALVTLVAASCIRFKSMSNSRELTAPGRVSERDAISAHWLWLALPFTLMILLAAMLPPLDFDVREYHLQAPKEFFLQGRIGFLPHNVYANMALGTEMLSLLAMVITGDWWLGALAGKTVIAMFTPLTAIAILLAGRRLFSPVAGVAAALVYISVPWVDIIASAGLVDGASACYLFLAVYALLLRDGDGVAVQLPPQQAVRFTHPTGCLALAGYLAGAAVAAKYPAVLFVLLPLAAWVVFAIKPRPVVAPSGATAGRRFMTAARHVAVFLLAAAVSCGLWFGKNWVQAGNPTYPLLYEVFDGKTWNVQKEQQWNRVHRPHDFSAEALGKDLGRVALSSEWLSPLIVPLAVLAFVGRRKRTLLWGLLAYIAFVIAAWWLLTHRIDRFWIPVLPIAALLAGAGACWSSQRWWRWVLAVTLAVGLGANFLVAASGQANAWFVPLAVLRNDPNWIDPWHQYFNAHVTEGRLLTVGEAAVFDLTMPVLYNTCFDDCIFEQMVRGKTPAEVRAALAARHVTYVYVNWGEIARYRSPGNYGFTDFVQPKVFDRLVQEGILEPLPPIEGHSGRGYRVAR
jgi:hypothetical protein